MIIGFAAGEIKEMGNHESLLSRENGVYANLCNMQTFDKSGGEKSAKFEKKKLEASKSVEVVSKTDEKVEEELPDVSWGAILGMNKPESCYIACGVLCSAVVGSLQPFFAIIFSEILELFSIYVDDPDKLMSELTFWALMFVAIGAANFFGNVGALSLFGKSGEELTRRLRLVLFSFVQFHLGSDGYQGFRDLFEPTLRPLI